jgi:RNA-directed DNA polymerase
MMRKYHVRICEGLRGRFPGSTRFVILVDEYRKYDWLWEGIRKRLFEELNKLEVEVNEEKTKFLDLNKGESFGFPGFDF